MKRQLETISHPNFFKLRLTTKINEAYKDKSNELITGRFGIKPTPTRIAIEASKSVEYLKALRDVIDLMQEVEDELNGEKEVSD